MSCREHVPFMRVDRVRRWKSVDYKFVFARLESEVEVFSTDGFRHEWVRGNAGKAGDGAINRITESYKIIQTDESRSFNAFLGVPSPANPPSAPSQPKSSTAEKAPPPLPTPRPRHYLR